MHYQNQSQREKNRKRVVFLNGPPGCGKDAVASHLVPYLSFHSMKFAAPLKRMVAGLLDLDLFTIEKYKNDEFSLLCRETEIENGTFGSRLFSYGEKDTIRRLHIRISEEFLKPIYGDTFLGRLAARELLRSSYTLAVFTDSGFDREADPIIRKVARENTILIRLHRDGCTFKGDSRSYLPDNLAGATRDIENNGHISHTAGLVAVIIRNHFGIDLLKEVELA